MAILEGTLRFIDPKFDMLTASESYAKQRVQEGLAPQAIFRSLTDEAQQLLPTLRAIPGRLEASLAAIANGRLKMRVSLFADARDRSLITDLVNLAALAFLAGATGVMAVLLLVSEAGPRITDTMTLFQIFGYMLVVLSGLLTLRVLFETLRFRRRD